MNNNTASYLGKALVALDRSAADAAILDYLNFWQHEIASAPLHFLHVLPKRNRGWLSWLGKGEPQLHIPDCEGAEQDIRKAAEQVLGTQTYAQAHFEAAEGEPLQKIVESIGQVQARWLVMGRKTNPNIYGAMARNIVRKAPVPVLVVPQDFRPQLKTIVVPIDFSDHSVQALQAALALNDRLRLPARIVALHLYELPGFNYYSIGKTQEQMRESIGGDVLEALGNFVRQHTGSLSDLIRLQAVEHEEGRLANSLYKAAQSLNADMVVMGAKGHSMVERLLLGSVTEQFLQENETICTFVVR